MRFLMVISFSPSGQDGAPCRSSRSPPVHLDQPGDGGSLARRDLPGGTAARIAATALVAPSGLAMTGRPNATVLSLRGGTMRSMHRRSAVVSPASASSTAFRTSLSASPSSRASAASVALCPGALRPTGIALPERPAPRFHRVVSRGDHRPISQANAASPGSLSAVIGLPSAGFGLDHRAVGGHGHQAGAGQ